jgi:hypothetical protein
LGPIHPGEDKWKLKQADAMIIRCSYDVPKKKIEGAFSLIEGVPRK